MNERSNLQIIRIDIEGNSQDHIPTEANKSVSQVEELSSDRILTFPNTSPLPDNSTSHPE